MKSKKQNKLTNKTEINSDTANICRVARWEVVWGNGEKHEGIKVYKLPVIKAVTEL